MPHSRQGVSLICGAILRFTHAACSDGNVRYYEHETDTLYPLDEHKSNEPQRGMCFLPRRALNIRECEIARAYKISGSYIEPIAFIVPRKVPSFLSLLYR
jgi:coronin-1B/1C/6